MYSIVYILGALLLAPYVLARTIRHRGRLDDALRELARMSREERSGYKATKNPDHEFYARVRLCALLAMIVVAGIMKPIIAVYTCTAGLLLFGIYYALRPEVVVRRVLRHMNRYYPPR